MNAVVNRKAKGVEPPKTRRCSMPMVIGGVALLGLVAMCFMAVWVADDVWNAVSRVIWLVLTAIGLILLATMSRLPQMLTLRRSLLLLRG